MAVASAEDFVALVRKSGLVTDEQLEAFLAQSVLPPEDSLAIADALFQARLVTEWQRDKLIEGRYKGFFLGKYKILSQLGAGAMGSVFLAEHLVMRHRVAIKTLAKRLLGRDEYIRRFEQEARAAAAVNHPRVVRAFDFDSAGDVYYLVMEFVEGEDLHKIVARDGVLPIPIAAECVRQTAEGLSAAHEAGLIHRDIKPSNLLVDKAGNVRILDLGLARLVNEDLPSLTLVTDSKMIGTVDFLAPEQARNSHHIDHRADLYSLGCTFYFLLCGKPPFDEGTLTQRVIEHQTKLPVDIRQRRRDCPAELAFICHKLLAKTVAERFQTAEEVVQALGEWQQRYEGALSGEHDIVQMPPTVLRKAAGSRGGGASRAEGSETGLTELADTHDSILASASTASSHLPAEPDELGLADDDVLSGPPALPAGSRGSASPDAGSGGASSASKAKRQPGSSVVTVGPGSGASKTGSAASSSKSGVGQKSTVGHKSAVSQARPAPSPDSALHSASSSPLTSADSLVDLLSQELPEALVSTRPLAAANPLGLAPLEADAESPSYSPGAEAYRRAAAEQASRRPRNWREQLQALVSEDGPGGISYSLWFLIAGGMLLGLIVCTVAVSYYYSTKGVEIDKNRSQESREAR